MSTETILLLGFAYLGLMTLVFCLLAMAKRGDEDAVAWDSEHRREDEPPRRRDAA